MKAGKIYLKPFDDFSERSLFITGVIFYFLGSLFAYFYHIKYNGFINIRFGESTALYFPFINNLVNTVLPSVILFLFAKMIYAKTRFIDVLNTVLIARIVIYLTSVLVVLDKSKSATEKITKAVAAGDIKLETVSKLDLFLVIFIGLFSLLIMIYYFYILIQGMKVAMNNKKIIVNGAIVIIFLIADLIVQFYFPYF
ncbi:hypothetical protein HMPREF0765_2920 [Sphingobacterium spiritivorum ATCC 33300]|uniref:Yip1 domain-containing protein n=1 Tax=Sphingobacterium spiritivorum ATCC 33300 TaxID=525372 RepID=C2G014_SPHSI|nr:hypothetical protein [Sphingobacterium spiritivorum]EEI91610.1 hypothetical protein HMPREF0765_2920 [Sphingobacterium spiritivorum ATCC 33300]QQS97318.1 hypothetical protein I6J03_06305 [Sphingobacterium spiritivorum]